MYRQCKLHTATKKLSTRVVWYKRGEVMDMWKCGDIVFFDAKGNQPKFGMIVSIAKKDNCDDYCVEIRQPNGIICERELKYDIEN